MDAEARAEVERVAGAGPFRPDWESLASYRVPAWYDDAKFGIFIHWGAYAVPAFGNEWYPRNMYREGSSEFAHHVATYGPQSRFGYKDLIERFTAERFDPEAWAGLFRNSGARFVVPVAEHHDGFAMYDCSRSDWNALRRGPRRDVVGELAAAVRRQGLVFGLSSHRAEHWWFFSPGMAFDSDVRDPRWAGLYGPAQPEALPPDEAFLEDWLLRTCELVDRYEPQIVWFDWWIEQPVFRPYLALFAAYYYNRGAAWRRGVAINYKNRAFNEGTAVYDVERGQLSDIRPMLWQTDTSVSRNSWGHVAAQDYKSLEALIGDLVDIVSKHGALLLNIGPRADGTIPDEEAALLLGLGRWLRLNGEAIYGTRPWKVFGEGPTEVAEGGFTDTRRSAFTPRDVRFTTRGDRLYAVLLARPEGRTATIRSLGTETRLHQRAIAKVELLGGGALQFSRDEAGLHVELPEQLPGEHAPGLRITPGGR